MIFARIVAFAWTPLLEKQSPFENIISRVGYKGLDATFMPREPLVQVGYIIDPTHFFMYNGGQYLQPILTKRTKVPHEKKTLCAVARLQFIHSYVAHACT